MIELKIVISLKKTLIKSLGAKRKMAIKGRNPTVNESKHMDNVSQLGCIVCRNRGFSFVPAKSIIRRARLKEESHFKVLPLCYEHHRGGRGEEPISRHPWKRRFEKEYGTEKELLELVQGLLDE